MKLAMNLIMRLNLVMMNNFLKFKTIKASVLIIHYQAFIYTNFTALVEALIKKYLWNGFFDGALYVND